MVFLSVGLHSDELENNDLVMCFLEALANMEKRKKITASYISIDPRYKAFLAQKKAHEDGLYFQCVYKTTGRTNQVNVPLYYRNEFLTFGNKYTYMECKDEIYSFRVEEYVGKKGSPDVSVILTNKTAIINLYRHIVDMLDIKNKTGFLFVRATEKVIQITTRSDIGYIPYEQWRFV